MIDLSSAVERFDLDAYLQAHGAVSAQAGEWVLRCPVCGKQKLTVNTNRRTWHCWVCERYELVATPFGPRRRRVAGAGGLVDLLSLLEGVDRRVAAERVVSAGQIRSADLASLPDRPVPTPKMRVPRQIPYPEGSRPIRSYGEVPYLARRGIGWDEVARFGLFVCDSGRYANRLVFPVYEEGRLVYYQARAMWDSRPGERYIKTLNPPADHCGVVSSDVLFNLDQAATYPRVAIVEGPVDAVRTGPDAVCTFGKRISAVQVARLLRAGVRSIDLMWDADAWSDMTAAAAELGALFDLRLVRLPDGDPGDRTRDELGWWRNQAQRYRGPNRLGVV